MPLTTVSTNDLLINDYYLNDYYLLILSAKLVHFVQKDKFLEFILQSTNTLSAKWKKRMNSPFYR